MPSSGAGGTRRVPEPDDGDRGRVALPRGLDFDADARDRLLDALFPGVPAAADAAFPAAAAVAAVAASLGSAALAGGDGSVGTTLASVGDAVPRESSAGATDETGASGETGAAAGPLDTVAGSLGVGGTAGTATGGGSALLRSDVT